MLCCFVNSIFALLQGFNLIGFLPNLQRWMIILMLIFNLMVMGYFLKQAYDDRKKWYIIRWIILGSMCNNIYIGYMLYQNMKYCYDCPNKSSCCHLKCSKSMEHKKQNCYHNNHHHKIKNDGIVSMIMQIIRIIGLIMIFFNGARYRQKFMVHSCEKKSCSSINSK